MAGINDIAGNTGQITIRNIAENIISMAEIAVAFIEDFIMERAWEVITKSNQLFEGVIFSEVITSIQFPLFKPLLKGTKRSFTRIPLVFLPISE